MIEPIASFIYAQVAAVSTNTAVYFLAGFVFLIAVLVLIVSVIVLQLLRTIVRKEEEKQASLKGIELPEKEPFWKRFLTKANDAVPVEAESTVMLDHNYDGIRELDNHLPPWWKWLFYISIVFAVVYMFVYHVFNIMPLQTEEYEADMAVAEKLISERLANSPSANIDESTVSYVEDAAALAAGKQVFDNNCAQCHRTDGGGNIGPNLTDEYWIHGGSIQDIFRTIKQGVPAKGMISWEPLLSPEQMQNVSSYIMSMGGTAPPNPKSPEGEVYRPEQAPEDVPDSLNAVAVR